MKAKVNKIIPFSNVDGPGNRIAIFLQECNFNCLYCHNPETINICNNCGLCVPECPVGALEIKDKIVKWDENKCIECDKCIKICKNNSSPKIKEYTVQEIVEKILEYKNFISGVTFSGGECTLNSKFITEVFKEIHKYGLTCFVDTNGFFDLEKVPKLIENTDGFMLDVKSWDNENHIKLTEKNNFNVIKNLNELIKLDKIYEVRTVVVPELLNNEETVKKVSEIIVNTDIRYKIIKYRKNGVRLNLINAEEPSQEYMARLKEVAEENGVKDIVLI